MAPNLQQGAGNFDEEPGRVEGRSRGGGRWGLRKELWKHEREGVEKFPPSTEGLSATHSVLLRYLENAHRGLAPLTLSPTHGVKRDLSGSLQGNSQSGVGRDPSDRDLGTAIQCPWDPELSSTTCIRTQSLRMCNSFSWYCARQASIIHSTNTDRNNPAISYNLVRKGITQHHAR